MDAVPTSTEGFLVIDPDSTSNREVIFYNSKTPLKVVCPSAADGRGQDGTSAVAHLTGTTVIMAPVAGMFTALQSGKSITPASITPTLWTNPYKFSVYRSAALTTTGVIQYDTKVFDTNNNLDITTNKGRYTVPVSGFYQLNVVSSQIVSAAPQDPQVSLRKNGSTNIAVAHFVNMYNGDSSGSANVSVLVSLTAGDYLEVITPNGRPLDVSGPYSNSFSGFLVSMT